MSLFQGHLTLILCGFGDDKMQRKKNFTAEPSGTDMLG